MKIFSFLRRKRVRSEQMRWPKPYWERVIRFPLDCVLFHVDVLRGWVFWLMNKGSGCLFCGAESNRREKNKRCFPVTRYGNFSVPKVICPCLQPPDKKVCNVPYCNTKRPYAATGRRLFRCSLMLLLCWSGIVLAMYLHPPTRHQVGRWVKPTRSAVRIQQINDDPARALIDEARELMAQNQWKRARITLLNAVQNDPDNGEPYFLLGEVYLKLDNIAQAVAGYRESVKYAPENLAYLQRFHTLASGLLQMNLVDPFLVSAPEGIRDRVPFKLMHADMMVRQGQRGDAATLLESVMSEPEVEVQHLLSVGLFLIEKLDQPVEGLRYVERAAMELPDDKGAMLLMAQALRVNNRVEEAQPWLDKLERAGFSDPALTYERIEFLVYKQEVLEAIEQLEALTVLEVSFFPAKSRLAELYLAVGQMDDAYVASRSLVDSGSAYSFAQGHLVLAQIALHNEFYRDAVKHAREAERVLGRSFEVLRLLALGLSRTGDFDQAKEIAGLVLSMRPQQKDIQLVAVAVDYNLGATNEAVRALGQLAKVDGLTVPVLVGVTELAMRMKQPEIARATLMQLVKEFPEDEGLMIGLIEVLERDQGLLPKLRSIAEHLVKAAPRSERAVTTLGRILLKSESLEADLPLFRQHVEAFPFSGLVRAQLGLALLGLEQEDEAQKVLEKALSLDPTGPDSARIRGVLTDLAGKEVE